MSSAYRAYAPATSANLSVGFDLLGAALRPVDGSPLGDFVTARKLPAGEKGNATSDVRLVTHGRYAARLPDDPRKNIVFDAYELYKDYLAKEGLPAERLELVLEKNLPVCSGLGSSACSVVAAVLALNAAHGNHFDQKKCMEIMGKLEGKISGSIHYDNVAPCYLGGMQFIVGECGEVSENVPFFKDWLWVMCFPGVKVSTAAARAILPEKYPRADVISYGRHIGAFIHASYSNNEKLALACLKDVIAEPYRADLIPGFKAAREKGQSLGALNTGISGSGSTIFSLFHEMKDAELMKEYLEREFIANEDGFCRICKIDPQGAFVETL